MIETLNIKKCVRVNTIFGTGVIHTMQRWQRIARQKGESFWYRTYGVKLDIAYGSKFKYLPEQIGFLHRDEIDIIEMVDNRITPDNVKKML